MSVQLIAKDNFRVVVGLGLTGLSCARYLSAKQLPFAVVDSRTQPPGLTEFEYEFPDVKITLGEISDEALAGANEIIVSPGVSLDEPAIARAIENGVAVCGDIDLFVREATAPVVAITGSNGKSTVTTLVGEMAKRAGKTVAVGGNIGVPALELLQEQGVDLYVIELSSFQLERAQPINAEVATVLNLSADHMDRYPDMLSYHQAKHRIFFGCKKVVVNRGDTLSKPMVAEGVTGLTFGLNQPDFKGFGLIKDENDKEYLAFEFQELMPVAELKMAGRHNIENALAAMALGHSVDLPMDAMLAVLQDFGGLPHRCQFVGELAGVRFYDDSKGTNVGASIAAITGLSDSAEKVVLIAGGQGKGADFKPLKPVLKQYGRAAVLMGEAANDLERALADSVDLQRVASMDEAVKQSASLAKTGDAVLLSPACASFDMFNSFEHRGEVFKYSVQTLIDAGVQV
jgi:UDP-N-acetylmuramoylalanine--D-glutamate ligase